jgi:CheY-like chemotaxis protein
MLATELHGTPDLADGSSTLATTCEAVAILVVDDSPIDRRLAGRLLEKSGQFLVRYAKDGQEALQEIAQGAPAAVLTDIQMPIMDGLQLVEEIRQRYPRVPVILMTGHGSEEIAIEALQRGATSYVPKRVLAKELVTTLTQVLNAAKIDRRQQKLWESLTHVEYCFELESDPALVPQLVAYFQENLLRMGLCDETGRIRIGIALEESLLNGIYHGNLELSSDLRQDGGNKFEELGRMRRHLVPYAGRRLHVHCKLSCTEALFVIRDQGPGFDPNKIADPTDPESLEKASGRGLLLIRSFMDSVSHNEKGNEITLIKRSGSKR